MALSFDVKPEDGYLHVGVTGVYEAGCYPQLGDVVAKQSEQLQQDRVLLDLRGLTGGIPDMDRFAAGIYGSQIWKKQLRVAVVLRRDAINRFFENTAINRGVQTLVVATLDEARSWLRVA